MDPSTAPLRPWFREPMVWLVIALPLAVVIAGFATLFIAIDAGGADPVRPQVQRTAQMQTADLAAEARARQLGLSATLDRDVDTGSVTVRLVGATIDAPRLRLSLEHPTRADADADTVLTRRSGAWLGRIPDPQAGHDWLLTVQPDDGQWRLHGRLRAGAGEALLQPDYAQ